MESISVMSRLALDLTNKKFGDFRVVAKMPEADKNGNILWLCECNCGNTWTARTANIPKLKRCPKCSRKGIHEKKYYIPQSGKRLWDYILKHDLHVMNIARGTGISDKTVRDFMYYGHDISSARLAKICDYCGVSMDYIMGLKEAE